MNSENNNKDYVFTCLHCNETFVINMKDFNCKILRHGVYKHNLQQINPHASKEECDMLVATGRIYGCAGPLQIIESESVDSGDSGDSGDSSEGRSAIATPNKYSVVTCDYI